MVIGIRYQNGFFIQEIVNNKQVEHPDPWLNEQFIWEEKVAEEAVEIGFYGDLNGNTVTNQKFVTAVPYDVKIVGDDNNVVTDLRLWATEASNQEKNQDESYMNFVSQISNSLYPDDSTEEGKYLRVQQQYLFSAAGLRSVLNEHKANGRNILDLPKFYTFQINDTHPTLLIPELMRVLMDEENVEFVKAFEINFKYDCFYKPYNSCRSIRKMGY